MIDLFSDSFKACFLGRFSCSSSVKPWKIIFCVKSAYKFKRNLKKLFCSPYVRLFSSVFLLWFTLNCSKMLSTALSCSVKQSFRSFWCGRKVKDGNLNLGKVALMQQLIWWSFFCCMISNTWVGTKMLNTLLVQWFVFTKKILKAFDCYIRLTNTF